MAYDPFSTSPSTKKTQKFQFNEEEDKRATLYKSTGVDYDKDVDGRVFAKDSDANRSLGVRMPGIGADGRVDLEGRRGSDDHIQGIPDTYAKLDEAKGRRSSVAAIDKGNRAQLDNFDAQHGATTQKVDKWDDVANSYRQVNQVSYANETDPAKLKALNKTRKYMSDEAERTEFSLNEIDTEIGGYYRTRSEWMKRQREAIGAQEGDVPEIDDKVEIGGPEWYQKIEDHGGVVGGAKRSALPSPHSGEVMGDAEVGGTPEGQHRDIEGVGDDQVRVTDTLLEQPVAEAQPEVAAGGGDDLSAVSQTWDDFINSTDEKGNQPTALAQSEWIVNRLSEIDDDLYEDAGENDKALFDIEKEKLMSELPARIEALSDFERIALHENTRDATASEWLANFGARAAASLGTSLVDMADFGLRNYLRFTPMGIASLRARNALLGGNETAFNNEGSRFFDATREVFDNWGPDVPQQVRQKLLDGKGTMFASGLASAVAFMIPGGAVLKLGRMAQMTPKALKALSMATSAISGAAMSGNNLRREVVQSNKVILDHTNEKLRSGEINREEFDSITAHMSDQADYAEGLGAIIGTSEIIGVGSILGRLNDVGGSALSKFALQKILKGGASEGVEKGLNTAIIVAAEAMAEMTEEAMQEFGQTVAQNAVASGWGILSDDLAWDHDRKLMDGTVEASATGGAVGLTLSLITSAMPGRARNRFAQQLEAEAMNELGYRLAAQKAGPKRWMDMEEGEKQEAIDKEMADMEADRQAAISKGGDATPSSPEMQKISGMIDELMKTPPAAGSGIQPFKVKYTTEQDPETGATMEREVEIFATSMEDALAQLAEQGIDNATVEGPPSEATPLEIVPTTVFTDKDGNEETIEGNPVEAAKKLPKGFKSVGVKPGEPVEKKPEAKTEAEAAVDQHVAHEKKEDLKKADLMLEQMEKNAPFTEEQKAELDALVERYPEVKAKHDAITKKVQGSNEVQNENEPVELAVGDKAQWTSQGADQFDVPREIIDIQDVTEPDGTVKRYAFFEGSNTGVPMDELVQNADEQIDENELQAELDDELGQEDDVKAPTAETVEAGDKAQWVVGGKNQFATPRKIAEIIVGGDGKRYATFSEGSNDTILVEDLTELTAANQAETSSDGVPAPGHPYGDELAEDGKPLSDYYDRGRDVAFRLGASAGVSDRTSRKIGPKAGEAYKKGKMDQVDYMTAKYLAKKKAKAKAKEGRETGASSPESKDEARKAIHHNFKPTKKGKAAIDQVLDTLERVVGQDAFKKVKIVFADAKSLKMAGIKNRAGGWASKGEGGVLMLNKDALENRGDGIVETLFHEVGHGIAEGIDDFISKEFNSLTPEQRKAAALEYDKKDTRSDAELMADKNTRQEWFNFQLFRVAKAGPEAYMKDHGISDKFAEKVVSVWNELREMVTQWIGDSSLSTEALDAKIVEVLFGADLNKESSQEVSAAEIDRRANASKAEQKKFAEEDANRKKGDKRRPKKGPSFLSEEQFKKFHEWEFYTERVADPLDPKEVASIRKKHGDSYAEAFIQGFKDGKIRAATAEAAAGQKESDAKAKDDPYAGFEGELRMTPSDEVLLPMARSVNTAVVQAVAEYKGATENALLAVLLNDYPMLAKRALRNRKATQKVIDAGKDHSDPEVRAEAKSIDAKKNKKKAKAPAKPKKGEMAFTEAPSDMPAVMTMKESDRYIWQHVMEEADLMRAWEAGAALYEVRGNDTEFPRVTDVSQLKPGGSIMVAKDRDGPQTLSGQAKRKSIDELKAAIGNFGEDSEVSIDTKQKDPNTIRTANAGPIALGKPFAAKTPEVKGKTVTGRWAIIDVASVMSSQDEGYGEGQDETLQPRDRTRQASVEQVQAIASNLDPERIIESLTSDIGAPFINDEGMVLSGNGRTLGVRLAYDQGSESDQKASDYKTWLLENAERFGFTEADIKATAIEPVLVRVVENYGGLTQGRFAELSNKAQVLGMSPTEQAASDARIIMKVPELGDLFNPGEDSFLVQQNYPFLNRFLDEIGDRATYVGKDGKFLVNLDARLKRALLAAAVGPDNVSIIDALLEDSEGIKRVANAVAAVAPKLSRLKGTEFDITEELASALDAYIEARRSGMTVRDFIDQPSLLAPNERTAEADRILEMFGRNMKSEAKIKAHFKDYMAQVASIDTSSQTFDLGIDETTKADILSNLDEAAKAENTDDQLELPKTEPKPKSKHEDAPTQDAESENLGGLDAEPSSVVVKTAEEALLERAENGDLSALDELLDQAQERYRKANNAYLDLFSTIADANSNKEAGKDVTKEDGRFTDWDDYIDHLRAKQGEFADAAAMADEEGQGYEFKKTEIRDKAHGDLVAEIKADLKEDGSSELGTAHWLPRIEEASEEELDALANWINTGNASPWATRFIGEIMNNEIGFRTGEVSPEERVQNSDPRVGMQWYSNDGAKWVDAVIDGEYEVMSDKHSRSVGTLTAEELDALIAKDKHEMSNEYEVEQIEKAKQAERDDAKKDAKRDRRHELIDQAKIYAEAKDIKLGDVKKALFVDYKGGDLFDFLDVQIDQKNAYVIDRIENGRRERRLHTSRSTFIEEADIGKAAMDYADWRVSYETINNRLRLKDMKIPVAIREEYHRARAILLEKLASATEEHERHQLLSQIGEFTVPYTRPDMRREVAEVWMLEQSEGPEGMLDKMIENMRFARKLQTSSFLGTGAIVIINKHREAMALPNTTAHLEPISPSSKLNKIPQEYRGFLKAYREFRKDIGSKRKTTKQQKGLGFAFDRLTYFMNLTRPAPIEFTKSPVAYKAKTKYASINRPEWMNDVAFGEISLGYHLEDSIKTLRAAYPDAEWLKDLPIPELETVGHFIEQARVLKNLADKYAQDAKDERSKPKKAPKETSYFKGDQIEFTGKVDGDLREFVYLEGHKKGEKGHIATKAKQAEMEAEQADRDQSQRDGAKRLDAANNPAPKKSAAKRKSIDELKDAIGDFGDYAGTPETLDSKAMAADVELSAQWAWSLQTHAVSFDRSMQDPEEMMLEQIIFEEIAERAGHPRGYEPVDTVEDVMDTFGNDSDYATLSPADQLARLEQYLVDRYRMDTDKIVRHLKKHGYDSTFNDLIEELNMAASSKAYTDYLMKSVKSIDDIHREKIADNLDFANSERYRAIVYLLRGGVENEARLKREAIEGAESPLPFNPTMAFAPETLTASEVREFNVLAVRNDNGELTTKQENQRFIFLEDKIVEGQKYGRVKKSEYSLTDAVDDIRAGRTNSPLKAINEAVKDAVQHRADLSRRSDARKVDRQRGKLAILDNITRSAKQGKVTKEAAQALTSFVNAIEDRFIDDVAVSIRKAGQAQGTYDFADSLVTMFRTASSLEKTGIHEFWHSLSRLIPESEVQKMADDYATSLMEYLKENPEFFAFVGRETISLEQFDEMSRFTQKANLMDQLKPEYDQSGELVRYRIGFTDENYRYHSLDEWIAEKMTDETMQVGDGLEPNTVMAKIIVALRRFMRLVKRHLGMDAYHNLYNAVFKTPDVLGFERFGPVSQATPLYDGGFSFDDMAYAPASKLDIFEDGKVGLKGEHRARVEDLKAQIDKHYSKGNFDQAEKLDVELEELLESIEGEATELESSSEEGRRGDFDNDSSEYDAASPDQEAELVNLLNRWNKPNSLESEDYPSFGAFARASTWGIKEGVTDEQIEEAANEALKDYERRFNNFKGKMAFAPETQSNPDFYSQLERVLEKKMPKSIKPIKEPSVAGRRFPARTIKGLDGEVIKEIPARKEADKPARFINARKQITDLLYDGGVKPDEVKWSGLEQWIDATIAEQGKVDKDELLAYLKDAGAVRFEEVTLAEDDNGNRYSRQDFEKMAEDQGLEGDDWNHMLDSYEIGEVSEAQMLNEIGEIPQDHVAGRGVPAYGEYVLPHGENYREVVLTMPSIFNVEEAKKLLAKGQSLIGMENGDPVQRVNDESEIGNITEFSLSDAESYTSSHFPSIPNYVAHMRLNERDGGLFIEEIQSDRHQAGREDGYREDIDTSKWRAVKSDLLEGFWNVSDGDGILISRVPVGIAKNADRAIAQVLDDKKGQGIADAPFRKDWHLQMFKRALRDAVAGGKSWVGWTDGETQAGRYDLRKSIDSIEWNTNKDGTYDLRAIKDGRAITGNSRATESDLSNLVGKELARKVVAGESTRTSGIAGLGQSVTNHIEGSDLKIGGEGMKGFYDKMLPSAVNKYVKKFGAKVEAGSVLNMDAAAARFVNVPDSEATTPIHRVTITDAMLKSIAQDGQMAFAPATAEAQVYNKPFPKAMRGKLNSAAESMADAGINTPEELAQILAEEFGGRINAHSQTLWNFIAGYDESGVAMKTPNPDWASLYAAGANPDGGGKVDNNSEQEESNNYADGKSRDLAGNSSGSTASNGVGKDNVPTPRGEGGRKDGASSSEPGSSGSDGQSSGKLPAGAAASSGATSDLNLFGEDESAGSNRSPAERGKSKGSSGSNVKGSNVQSGGNESTGTDANSGQSDGTASTSGLGDPAVATRIKSQKAANKKDFNVKWGDLQSITEVAPILLKDQHADLVTIEKRFFGGAKASEFNPNGKGMLITNGTGTGKTFVGLGTAKRFIAAGKKEILFVVPAGKVVDWIEDAKLIGIEANGLENTKTVGEGVTVVGHEAFRMNQHLLTRKFDLVVVDEVHKLASSKDGNETKGLRQLRILAGHHRQYQDLAGAYRDPEWFAAKVKLDGILEPLENRLKEVEQFRGADDRAAREFDDLESKIRALNNAFYQRFLPKRDEHTAAGEAIYAENKFLGLSATPFAYHKSLEWGNGYIFNWDHGMRPNQEVMIGNSRQSPKERFFVKHLGYQIRYHKLTQPDANVDVSLMERELSTKLTESGGTSGRMIALDYDYSRQFVLTDSELGSELDRGASILKGHVDKDNEFRHLSQLLRTRLNYVKSMQLLESIKATEAVARAKKHVALGRKVVIFHSYMASAPQHPFRFSEKDLITAFGHDYQGNSEKDKAREEITRFEARYPELVNLDFSKVANVLDLFQDQFGDQATYFNGQTLSPKKRQAGMEEFNKSGSGVDVMVAQVDAAQEGLSLHDKDGKHQRVIINIGLPVKPVTVAQMEGRIYRVGLQSHAIYENLVLHTNMERTMFGERASERSSTVENLAMGDLARNLKVVLRQGYMDAQYQVPGADQGTGGVANDRRIGATSDFDRAKTYYYGRQKRNSRTKAIEGKDYFATPEPLGAKMVEWANPSSGEAMLEPSTGHAAIARFFPETTSNTFVEPSGALISEAMVSADGRFVHGDFEDLHISNKFDAIVMNPPFGSGGKTAFDHIAKAVVHLHNGGRIVAIVPYGPAADKQFDKFLADPKNADVYVPQIINLPAVTFERAGTKVATRILIIDKIDNKEFAEEQGFRRYVHEYTDLGEHTDINEFFDDIEDMKLPGRVAVPVKEKMKKTKGKEKMAALLSGGRDAKLPSVPSDPSAPVDSALFKTEEIEHTKTGETLYSAKTNTKVEDWKEMKALFTQHGGYWSRFSKSILFKKQDGRDAFVAEYEQMIRDEFAHTPTTTSSELDALMDDMAYAPRSEGTETEERIIGETIGDLKDRRTIFGRIRDYMTDLTANDALRFRQGVFDSFASIREYEKNIFGKNSVVDAAASGHKMALMTKNLPSVMMQVMTKGTLEYVNGSVQIKEGSQSLAAILNMVGDKRIKLWEGYVAAVRSKRLIGEGKENNFADDPEGMKDGLTAEQKIDQLLALGEQYPEFEQARLAYQKWNQDLLDFAESAGIINPSTREVWEKNDYVPFYRIAESVDGKIVGPRKNKGLSAQDAGIRQLKGGEGRIAVIENIYKNAEKLVDASFKNIAMQRITDLAEASDGVLTPIPHKAVPFKVAVKEIKDELEKNGVETDGMTDEDLSKMVNFWRMKAPKGEDVVSVSYNGKPKYFKVNDPLLLASILDLGPQEQNPIIRFMGKPKQFLTAGITLDPTFMVANWMRDSLNAYFVSESPLRPGLDSIKGIVDVMAESDSYHAIMASGGSSGAYQRLNDKDIRRELSSMTKGHQRKFSASIIDSPHRAINLLKRVGRASEMANRVAVYDAAIRTGATPQEAAYQAMDLTNFTMHGASQVIRTFTTVVPFLNARLQGLYKLGRAGAANPKRFAGHAMVMTAATLALMLKNWDDERYWELEDWDRDLYYHMWFGDEHVRIPKPFEVGAVFSTLPERITEAIWKRGDADLLIKSMGTTTLTTFAFNPIPQAVVPVVEQMWNKSFFGFRPIVSGGDKYKSPEQQFSPWTSETFREVAKAMPSSAPEWARSPKRLEHMWRGYTGTIGTYVVDMADMLTRQAGDYPRQPDFEGADGVPVISNMKRRFNPEDGTRSNRYIGEFYKLYNKVLKVEQGIRDSMAEGDKASVDKLQEDNRELLAKSAVLKQTSSNMSKLRKEQNAIYFDKLILPKAKAERLKELNKRRNKIAGRTVRLPDPTR